MTEVIRIIGFDPGLRRTGWGVIEQRGARLSSVASGAIAPPADPPMAERLRHLLEKLQAVIAEHAPQEAAVEKTFVNANPASALVLGQARAMALLAPALAGASVAEYAPNEVKKSVVGVGHADKAQVQAMIRVLLPMARPDCADAADALAVAIAHAHARGGRALRRMAS